MQYTKLETTIPTKPKYSKFTVTAMPAQLQSDGVWAVLPNITVEMSMAINGMIRAFKRYSGCSVC
jgi:hypothetical protein